MVCYTLKGADSSLHMFETFQAFSKMFKFKTFEATKENRLFPSSEAFKEFRYKLVFLVGIRHLPGMQSSKILPSDCQSNDQKTINAQQVTCCLDSLHPSIGNGEPDSQFPLSFLIGKIDKE